jgi:hypothetical protein
VLNTTGAIFEFNIDVKFAKSFGPRLYGIGKFMNDSRTLEFFNWMADTTIPKAEPDRAIFFWAHEGLVDVHLESWPLPAALSACRFLSCFLSLTSYYGNQGLVQTSMEKLEGQFGLEKADAWSRAHVSWQIICYGLRDFQGALSGLLLAHDESQPALTVLASGVHYWAIHEAVRCLPGSFPELDPRHFCSTKEALALAHDFLTALNWEARSLKAFDEQALSPYMNLSFVSDIAADYEAEAGH